MDPHLSDNFDEGQVSFDSRSSAVSLGSDQVQRIHTVSEGTRRQQKHEFKSYQLHGKYEQPWIGDKRLKRTKYNDYIVWSLLLLSLVVSGYMIWHASTKVPVHDYCLILDDQFAVLNESVWNYEIQLNGFGTGSFDWTTDDPRNSFIDGDGLHIVPTLTNDSTQISNKEIINGFALNLTKAGGDGSCTATENFNEACSIRSNMATGNIIPPVRSARLNTKGKKSIKYGRVEVVARMGSGDWLWPAIWMMPENDLYGQWPQSGEIDIMESRGNSYTYPTGGNDALTSTIHWGPTPKTDSFWLTTDGLKLRRSDLTKDFHTFGLEWSENYLFTYLDNRLSQVLYVNFKREDMWTRGGFAQRTENSTLLANPWAISGEKNTPFDQEFFLILNVAVGSRNGWFPDGVGSKPWADAAPAAAADFYKAANKWLQTWGNETGMTIQSVKMWQQGKCN